MVDVVGSFDGRVMTVKGRWKALAFWFIEGQPKTQQWRCYSRMRDIELAHYRLNRVQLPELGEVPRRIDQQWAYTGEIPDRPC